MDDPNEENIESSWIMINTIDIAEEATTLNHNENLEDSKVYKNHDNIESDVESDGISVISESSHLHESNNEEENFMHNDPVSTECASQPKTEPKMNWTYVDSEPRSPMASSNQFYLNCLQEPIQELCEHELGSVQSDLESDGISIISDCESLNDFTDNEKKLNEEILSKENCHNERLELASNSLLLLKNTVMEF
ncbi:hypothetical protein NQ314_017676 [Rhamnusium bicolor]|uniref:Uncharacterized protein n=1 Tax=Rhamnusium bicolor TaxID=1586634 RepID=A0AAV8WSB3_9CUCU|nr:hypothetical protein NQ314_017676 [Rhamnusium bicolor]